MCCPVAITRLDTTMCKGGITQPFGRHVISAKTISMSITCAESANAKCEQADDSNSGNIRIGLDVMVNSDFSMIVLN